MGGGATGGPYAGANSYPPTRTYIDANTSGVTWLNGKVTPGTAGFYSVQFSMTFLDTYVGSGNPPNLKGLTQATNLHSPPRQAPGASK